MLRKAPGPAASRRRLIVRSLDAHYFAYYPAMTSRLRLPHALVLLLGCVAVAVALTWFLPAGTYQLRAWHPGLPVGAQPLEQRLPVTATGISSATIRMPGLQQ